jgi:hypothetical protein
VRPGIIARRGSCNPCLQTERGQIFLAQHWSHAFGTTRVRRRSLRYSHSIGADRA